MTSIEEHRKKLKELFEELEEAIDAGIERRATIIGFNTSLGAAQLLELYLHKLNKISIGKVVKHNWFKRPKDVQRQEPLINRKLDIDFPNRQEIYNLICDIEDNREKLVYGKSDKVQIEKTLKDFEKLKEVLQKKLKEVGEEIG